MEYDQAARQRLGREVRAARVRAGFANRESFADKMKRSARQVQALENGESGVGPDTWAAAADVLGWPLAQVYELLDGVDAGSTPSPLTDVSDEQIVAEVLRRMKGDAGGDTTPTRPVRPLSPTEREVQETVGDLTHRAGRAAKKAAASGQADRAQEEA